MTARQPARAVFFQTASQRTGAGFGGCAIAIVNKDKVNAFTKAVGTKYEEVVGYAPAFYIAEIAGGSRVLSRNN